MIKQLLSLIDAIAQRRVAVIGDVIADEFIYGQLSRVSREAPVLILKYDGTTVLPGGAGNAATNVASLGGRARLVGLLGYADVDRRMLRALPRGVDRSGLIRSRQYRAPVKTRILAGGSHSTRQQVVRVDREANTPIDARTRTAFEQAVRQSVMDCDAVLVSDYGSGLVTPSLVSLIKRVIKRSGRRPAVPVVIDSRFELLRYRGVTACTPNESEVEQSLGVTIGDDSRRLERAGRTLLKRLKAQGIVLTRGSRGMAVFVPGKRTVHVPVFGTDEVADVTGAGDTVIATVSLALAAGSSFDEAARLANYAGGLVVMKRGTAAVSADELRRVIQSDFSE
jgi:rfaE bifunctional protein kinase chain/domain